MRWIIRSQDSEKRLGIGLTPLVERLLASRGINTPAAAQEFLHPHLSYLHSPYLMLGMKGAVERVRKAINAREKILIYGDYDVDGTVAIVILKTAIEICGGHADFHIPHRIRDGYGMKDEVIEEAAADGVQLVVSVDTGIRAFAAAETARRAGVDLIVTDHHLAEGEEVPHALAVLNPNQRGCGYPCKELCGAGVAFKLAQALLEENRSQRLIPSFLKMVAIATIADAVPLTGENRVFTKLGLNGLRSPANHGLRALLRVAGFAEGSRTLTAGDVGFRLGPRLNAAGRMDVAHDVIELFTTRNEARATEIAEKLDQLNATRQQEEARITQEIEAFFEKNPRRREPHCLVLDGEGWHRGVIGIVATRVVERHNRPALVIARDGESGQAHGSGRSIAAFHLLAALEQENCRQLFTRFGGHAHAVGFSLPSLKIEELRSTLESYAGVHLSRADLEPVVEADAEVSADDITSEVMHQLAQLEPFGRGNPEPLFMLRGARICQETRVLKQKHLKLRIGCAAQGGERFFDALGWHMAERLQAVPLSVGDSLDLVFSPEQNSNPESPGIQLVLRDFRVANQSRSLEESREKIATSV